LSTQYESSRLVITNTSIVSPHGTREGWVLIQDGRIQAVGHGETPAGPRVDLHGSTLRPGYIDLHCHGGGGATVYTGDVDDVIKVASTHLLHGTTSMMASLTAAPKDALVRGAQSIVEAAATGRASNLAGIHFEGPFLSEHRPGAQPKWNLRSVDRNELEELLIASGTMPVSMTIAPELPGAVSLIARYSDRVKFFIGHTDATARQFDEAVDAGATAVTHLFNAMPPVHHRKPGPVVRALLDERVTSELILDGHHLDANTLLLALSVAGPGRLFLVTDAMAAAGMVDGEYCMPGLRVTVQHGAAYVHGTSTLAGSALLMDQAVERLISVAPGNDQHVSLMSAANAARVMGWTDRGSIEAGKFADLVATDERGRLHMVISRGVVITDVAARGWAAQCAIVAAARAPDTADASASPFNCAGSTPYSW